jgi:hypothetical protein
VTLPFAGEERGQIAVLARTFLARFFDNEISGGSTDLKQAFLLLLGALAGPAVLIPVASSFRWEVVALVRGPDYLRLVSAADKAAYLAMTMAAVSVLTAIVWDALLMDRRDAHVLGGFPVRPRTVVAGKLAALSLFILIVAIGGHAAAAIFYGVGLGTRAPILFALRGIAAHLLAAAAAGTFAYALVIATQGVLLSLAGPRLFWRLTAALQLALAAVAIGLFLMSPLVGAATLDFARGDGPLATWATAMPPAWFVGIYEVLLGGASARMRELARIAALASAVVLATVVVTYPLAYRRLIAAALIEGGTATAPTPFARVVSRVPAWLTNALVVQAVVQYTLATLARVSRHKLIVALSLGTGLASVVPIALSWIAVGALPPEPSRGLLAIPMIVMLFLLSGIRVAYSVPAELGAAWMFQTAPGGVEAGSNGARRVLIFAGVLVPSLGALMFAWQAWGPGVAAAHVAVCASAGVLAAELLLGRFDGVPFTRAYQPARANLQARWPLYFGGLILFVDFVPRVETALLRTQAGVWVLVGTLLAGVAAVRYFARADRPESAFEILDEEPAGLRL